MLDYLIARMRNSAMIAVFGAAALAVSVSAAAAQTVSQPLYAAGAVVVPILDEFSLSFGTEEQEQRFYANYCRIFGGRCCVGPRPHVC